MMSTFSDPFSSSTFDDPWRVMQERMNTLDRMMQNMMGSSMSGWPGMGVNMGQLAPSRSRQQQLGSAEMQGQQPGQQIMQPSSGSMTTSGQQPGSMMMSPWSSSSPYTMAPWSSAPWSMSRWPESMMAGASGSLVTPIRMEVSETADKYNVRAEVPGFRREDICVNVDENTRTLTMSGERKEESQNQPEGARETRYRRFQRTTTLPPQADPSNVNAEYRDGMLSVAFNKRPVPGKQINIS